MLHASWQLEARRDLSKVWAHYAATHLLSHCYRSWRGGTPIGEYIEVVGVLEPLEFGGLERVIVLGLFLKLRILRLDDQALRKILGDVLRAGLVLQAFPRGCPGIRGCYQRQLEAYIVEASNI